MLTLTGAVAVAVAAASAAGVTVDLLTAGVTVNVRESLIGNGTTAALPSKSTAFASVLSTSTPPIANTSSPFEMRCLYRDGNGDHNIMTATSA